MGRQSLILSLALSASLFTSAGWSAIAEPAAIGASGRTSAQQETAEKARQTAEQVIRLTSRLVIVPVSASDGSGRPITDLTADDFVIEEEGVPQRIIPLGEPGKTAVEIALLFDVSSSIHSQFAFQQQAATRFIEEVLNPTDAVSIFSVGVTPKLVQPRTKKCDEAVRGLASIKALKEPTAFVDSVVEAARYLGRFGDAGSRRVLVVISDGEENFSKHNTLTDSLRELQKNDCLFYAINPGGAAISLNKVSRKGHALMDSMSFATGGKSFVLDQPADLDGIFGQISGELQAQYLFGYYSNDETADGGFRRITVRSRRTSGIRVRARQGYYAPNP